MQKSFLAVRNMGMDDINCKQPFLLQVYPIVGNSSFSFLYIRTKILT